MALRRIRTRLKTALVSLVSGITRRHAVLLPREARNEDTIFDIRAPYRLEGSVLKLRLRELNEGWLTARLLAYQGHFPTQIIWQSDPHKYVSPCDMTFDLTNGSVRIADCEWGRVPPPLPTRRFC